MADIALTIDPSGTSYALHDRANGRQVMGFDAPVPDTDSQWASSADTEGARRANLRYQNRVITARVLVIRSTDALLQAAENVLGQKVAKLAREGGELRFTYPTGTTITFTVLEASFQRAFDIADTARQRAVYEVSFVCLPFGLGTEVDLGDNVETTLPVLIFTETGVGGDVSGWGRLVIDDDSGADQWWVTFGIQSRYYSSSANAALFYEAEGRTAMGGSAIAAGPTGASGAGSNVMRNTALLTTYLAIMSTQATAAGAHLSHIGTFHAYARVQVPTTNTGEVTVALEWGEADFLRYTRNAATTIPAAQEGLWRLIDLGLVSPREVTQGTQRWEGRIIALSSVAGDDIDVDWLMLVPADEGSGIVSGVIRDVTPTVISARDDYLSTTAGNALNARVAPTGGTWATSGAATDLLFADPVGAFTTEHLTRNATGTRFAILGSTNYTNVAVSTLMYQGAAGPTSGVIARWTDASNHLVGRVTSTATTIVLVVAGVETVVATGAGVSFDPSLVHLVRLVAYANGRVIMTVVNPAGLQLVGLSAISTVLATGGTLATGKPGISDVSSVVTNNRYDDFLVSVPVPDAAMFASQSLEVRYDRVTREDSGGGVWNGVSSFQGDYLRVPPAGQEARTSRVIIKGSRADPLTEADPAIDDISARLFVTPRYLVVPS